MKTANPQDFLYGAIFRMTEAEMKEIVLTYLRRHLSFELYDKLNWDVGADEDNNRIYAYFNEDVFDDTEMQELFEVFTEFDGSCDYDIIPNILSEYMKVPNFCTEVSYYGWGTDGGGMVYIEVLQQSALIYNKLEPWGFDDAN